MTDNHKTPEHFPWSFLSAVDLALTESAGKVQVPQDSRALPVVFSLLCWFGIHRISWKGSSTTRLQNTSSGLFSPLLIWHSQNQLERFKYHKTPEHFPWSFLSAVDLAFTESAGKVQVPQDTRAFPVVYFSAVHLALTVSGTNFPVTATCKPFSGLLKHLDFLSFFAWISFPVIASPIDSYARSTVSLQLGSLVSKNTIVIIKLITIGGIVSKETVCCVGGKVKH